MFVIGGTAGLSWVPFYIPYTHYIHLLVTYNSISIQCVLADDHNKLVISITKKLYLLINATKFSVMVFGSVDARNRIHVWDLSMTFAGIIIFWTHFVELVRCKFPHMVCLYHKMLLHKTLFECEIQKYVLQYLSCKMFNVLSLIMSHDCKTLPASFRELSLNSLKTIHWIYR